MLRRHENGVPNREIQPSIEASAACRSTRGTAQSLILQGLPMVPWSSQPPGRRPAGDSVGQIRKWSSIHSRPGAFDFVTSGPSTTMCFGMFWRRRQHARNDRAPVDMEIDRTRVRSLCRIG